MLSGLLVNDASRRMPEDVKAMRPRSALDFGPIHRRIKHRIAHEVRIARAPIQLAEDEIRIRRALGNLPMPLENTNQRLRQMLHEFSISLGRWHDLPPPNRLPNTAELQCPGLDDNGAPYRRIYFLRASL